MNSSRLLPGARAMLVVDVLMAVWVAAWIGLGVAIGIDVEHLTNLSRSVAADGAAVQAVGHSLSAVQAVPIIGGALGQAANQIAQAGANTAAGARSTASSVHTLAVLLAVAVALLPSVPVLGFYLPVRLNRRREARALRRALRRHAGDPAFEQLLAQRALGSLGYRRLEALTGEGAQPGLPDRQRLADAELARLGIRRDRRPPGDTPPRR